MNKEQCDHKTVALVQLPSGGRGKKDTLEKEGNEGKVKQKQSYLHTGFQEMFTEFLLGAKHETWCHSLMGKNNIIQIIYK